jgi:uncharacterized protein (UPF0262 family)
MDSDIAQLELYGPHSPLAPDSLACEQQAALRDLLAQAHFRPVNDTHAPYDVRLSIADGRLVVAARNSRGADLSTLVLSLRPYKRVIEDYFLMIHSFEAARHEGNKAKLEAIDMGRRGLHNEGAELLAGRLADKVEIDHETARRLFTLICALHKDHVRLVG